MNNAPELTVKDKQQHQVEYLGLIQGNISRMAGNSALMKGFAATFMAAIIGISIADSVKWYYILASVIPLFAFIRLDIYYLQLEKRYRNLYALIAEKKIHGHNFALDLNAPIFKKYKKLINKDSGFFKTMFSVSVLQFYCWFIALPVALIIFIA